MTYDAEEVEDEDLEHLKALDASLDTTEIADSVEVSLNSIMGLTTLKTM